MRPRHDLCLDFLLGRSFRTHPSTRSVERTKPRRNSRLHRFPIMLLLASAATRVVGVPYS